jgi:TolB-like protein
MIVIDSNIDQSRAISSCEVSQTLERVLGSKTFLRSRRLSQFLRFAVEQDLAGRQDQLKEYTIGTQVYGRTPDFDPSQDSIVRAEARRLRMKLKEYEAEEGQNDDTRIIFRPGSYVPSYRRNITPSSPSSIASAQADDVKENCDPGLVVFTAFDSPAADPFANSLAFSLTDELLHRLTQVGGVRVVCLAAGKTDVSKYASHTVLSGVVRTEGDRVFVTAREATAFGLVKWSERFEWPAQDSKPTVVSAVTNAVLHRVSQRPIAQNNWSGSAIRISGPVRTHDHSSQHLNSVDFASNQYRGSEYAELVT